MSDRPQRGYDLRFRVTGAMALVLLAALIFKWPLLLFPAIPLVLYVILKRFGIERKWWEWAIITLIALIAYPLTGGPVARTNLWLAEKRIVPRRFLPTLELYRPLFRAVRGTRFDPSLRNYSEWWLGDYISDLYRAQPMPPPSNEARPRRKTGPPLRTPPPIPTTRTRA